MQGYYSRFMRRLLRNVKNGRYYAKESWVSEESGAYSFHGPTEAINACIEHGLRDVELIIRSDAGQPDLCVPIPNAILD